MTIHRRQTESIQLQFELDSNSGIDFPTIDAYYDCRACPPLSIAATVETLKK
ncbi:hypothetical protein BDW02DRAFT_565758 [Decorospora gaudefroyi]|uniref:Uncharacterized protein n=1 Tax=Decorospora gaudefroyi TaxID=184978 RepID=A0A6A5KKL4_9PLEO|nr:hypothetical protein BDW02DRAFT_565758 [Decorospora gaudefroyi]